MKYYSEVLKKFFDDPEECQIAEKEVEEARRKAQEEKEKLLAERKERADKVEEARKTMIEAQKEFKRVLNEFVVDYGTYHYSTSNADEALGVFDAFDWLF